MYKNLTKIDSLKFKDWYCNAKIKKFDSTKKLCQYNFAGGSGINLKNQFLVSINNDKIIQNLNIELHYKESVLGDSTFKKSFKRKTTILKTADDSIIYLKRTCFKNDIQYYYTMVKLNFDKENQIYCNKIIKYKNEFAKGIELDSSSYIYLNQKWYEFDVKNKKIYSQM